jgi:hypothetical protein
MFASTRSRCHEAMEPSPDSSSIKNLVHPLLSVAPLNHPSRRPSSPVSRSDQRRRGRRRFTAICFVSLACRTTHQPYLQIFSRLSSADRRLNRVFSALLCCLKCMARASFSLLLQNAGAIARGHKCQSYCSRGSPVLCSCVLG